MVALAWRYQERIVWQPPAGVAVDDRWPLEMGVRRVAYAAADGDGAYYAGGTELLQVMKMGFAQVGTLIDLKRLLVDGQRFKALILIAGIKSGSIVVVIFPHNFALA